MPKTSRKAFSSAKRFHDWKSIKEIKISRSGKHEIPFADDFPFALSYWVFTDDYHLTPNYHDYLELTYIASGHGEFLIENRTFEFARGDLFLVSNNEFHSLQAMPGSSFRTYAIYFLPSLVYRMGGDLRDSRLLWPFFNRSREFENKVPLNNIEKKSMGTLFSRIGKEHAEQGKEFELGIKGLLSEILLSVLRVYPDSSFSGRKQLRRDEEITRIEKVLRYAGEKYTGPVTLGEAAKIACMSESHFCLVFKKTTGHTLLDYTHRLRIDRARELLLCSDLKVGQIAYESGFDSPSHFFKIFRRLVHQTPQEYVSRSR